MTRSEPTFDSLVRSGDPEVVALALAKVDGVRSAVVPADGRRDGTAVITVIPTADGNSPEGRATLDRIRAATHNLPADVVTGGAAAQSADRSRDEGRENPVPSQLRQRTCIYVTLHHGGLSSIPAG